VRAWRRSEVLETRAARRAFLTYGLASGFDNMTPHHGPSMARHIGLGAHPVRLDVGRVKEVIDEPECQPQMQELREQLKRLCAWCLSR